MTVAMRRTNIPPIAKRFFRFGVNVKSFFSPSRYLEIPSIPIKGNNIKKPLSSIQRERADSIRNPIPEEKLKSLFGKFIRIDDKTTRTTRGTGLGLFIVKGLVEAMNGQIKISSTDEIGFKVDVTFKLFKSNQ